MKALQTILFLLGTISIHSQGFCEYGDYDYLFNTIKGVSKSSFKKIEVKNKDTSVYIENYNDKGDLINSNYNETISVGEFTRSVSMDNPCYTEEFIEQEENDYLYEYSEEGKITKAIAYLNKNLNDTNIYTYDSSNKLKKIKAEYLDVDHEYYENGLLKKIDRNGKTFEFFWNSKGKLKKIITTPTDYSYIVHLFFEYNLDNTINTIIHKVYDKVTKEQSTEKKDVFCYSNKKLSKITSTGYKIKGNKKEKRSVTYYEFEHKKKEKMIINVLDMNKKDIKHYECYYY